jgi:hypothetical protein
MNKKRLIIVLLFVFIISVGAGVAAFLLWPKDPKKDLIGQWHTDLEQSEIILDFNEENLTITSSSSVEGIQVSNVLLMDYEVDKDKDIYIIDTNNHEITSVVNLNEEEIFDQYPEEYLSALTDEQKQEYIKELEEQLLSLEEEFKESVSQNSTLEIRLSDDKDTLKLTLSALEQEEITLEKKD